MAQFRRTFMAFVLGVVAMLAVVFWIGKTTPREAPLPNNDCRYLETIKHPDEDCRLALLEVVAWDRPDQKYYVTVMLTDREDCYVSPARVYRKDSPKAATETFFQIGSDEVKNAILCTFPQNPVGFGSASGN